jgi:hypothetical protein
LAASEEQSPAAGEQAFSYPFASRVTILVPPG